MPTRIPADFPVKVLRPGSSKWFKAKRLATCNTCGRSWDDSIPTSYTPVPSARCPFEHFHADPAANDRSRAPVAAPAGPYKVHTGRSKGAAACYVIGTHLETLAETQGHDAQAEAVAHLFAAAPELLAAMEDLFRECAMVHKYGGTACNRTKADAAIARARAAIDCARQRQA